MNDFTGRIKRDEWRPPTGVPRSSYPLVSCSILLVVSAQCICEWSILPIDYNLRRGCCLPGFQRTVTIALDTAQYQLDMEYMQEHKSEDVYSTFNLLMRRKPKVIVASLRSSCTRLQQSSWRATGRLACHCFFSSHSRPCMCLSLCAVMQENNFKAVLESIRDLMNEETVLPEWLHDIFLGYGDPAAAQYTKLPNTLRTLDFKVSAFP